MWFMNFYSNACWLHDLALNIMARYHGEEEFPDLSQPGSKEKGRGEVLRTRNNPQEQAPAFYVL